jgi:peroxiredoxin
LRQIYPDIQAMGIQVAAVFGQDPAPILKYLAAYPTPFPILADIDRSVIQTYGVFHLISWEAFRMARPSAFAIDKTGTIRYIHVSSSQFEWPEPAVLLAEAAKVAK